MALIAGTKDTRSGDRVRNGMVIGGLSATGLSIMLDPYITRWMLHQTSAYGIVFSDPEGWKDATVQFAIVLLTALWGTLHMVLIRLADKVIGDDFSDPPGPPPGLGIGGRPIEIEPGAPSQL